MTTDHPYAPPDAPLEPSVIDLPRSQTTLEALHRRLLLSFGAMALGFVLTRADLPALLGAGASLLATAGLVMVAHTAWRLATALRKPLPWLWGLGALGLGPITLIVLFALDRSTTTAIARARRERGLGGRPSRRLVITP